MRRATLCVLFTVIGAPEVLAQTSSVDWKLYGTAHVEGEDVCFYDAKGVVHAPDGHVRVWTKCLLQKDLDGVNIEKDFGGAIVENTAQKVLSHYVPPIAMVETVDANQSMTITQYEVTADVADIQPQASIFYELNCSERMERELSMSFHINGKSGGRDNKPLDWKYVPPEGNGATLLKLLCPAR